jgi:hypothetical protein
MLLTGWATVSAASVQVNRKACFFLFLFFSELRTCPEACQVVEGQEVEDGRDDAQQDCGKQQGTQMCVGRDWRQTGNRVPFLQQAPGPAAAADVMWPGVWSADAAMAMPAPPRFRK